ELRRADPARDLSPRTQVYMSLVLILTVNGGPRNADNEEEVNIFVEALSDKNRSVRREAARSCIASVGRNRQWFHEAHCRAMLPFLDDKDPILRGIVARIFSRLAPFQHEALIQGLQEAYKQARERAAERPSSWTHDYPFYPCSYEYFELA